MAKTNEEKARAALTEAVASMRAGRFFTLQAAVLAATKEIFFWDDADERREVEEALNGLLRSPHNLFHAVSFHPETGFGFRELGVAEAFAESLAAFARQQYAALAPSDNEAGFGSPLVEITVDTFSTFFSEMPLPLEREVYNAAKGEWNSVIPLEHVEGALSEEEEENPQ